MSARSSELGVERKAGPCPSCGGPHLACCERCGEELTGAVVWLELDTRTNTYYERHKFPASGVSQGLFSFGVACGKVVLWEGGLDRIGRARRRGTLRPCPACGRLQHMLTATGGKATKYRHKCPHGAWCIAGDPISKAGGWNPGGIRHAIECERCAQIIREDVTP